MAIDKRSTQPWVKAVIIVVAVSFILFPVASAIVSSLGSGQPKQTTQSALEQAGARGRAQVESIKSALASDPASYTVLVALGNAYYDWGAEVQQASPQSGLDLPMWDSAALYYSKALAKRPGDPNVGTDMAISYFYSGQTAEAILAVETVLKKTPDFAAALYNSGIFYSAAGRNADGIAALERYLKVDPQGNSGQPANAQKLLSQMKAAGSSAPAPSAGSTVTTP